MNDRKAPALELGNLNALDFGDSNKVRQGHGAVRFAKTVGLGASRLIAPSEWLTRNSSHFTVLLLDASQGRDLMLKWGQASI